MSSRTEPKSHHLESLLSKLRPFQRKAYDFAVHGILPADDIVDNGVAERGKDSLNHDKSHEISIYSGQQAAGSIERKQVAGAGTGRILLGDEMGLG